MGRILTVVSDGLPRSLVADTQVILAATGPWKTTSVFSPFVVGENQDRNWQADELARIASALLVARDSQQPQSGLKRVRQIAEETIELVDQTAITRPVGRRAGFCCRKAASVWWLR